MKPSVKPPLVCIGQDVPIKNSDSETPRGCTKLNEQKHLLSSAAAGKKLTCIKQTHAAIMSERRVHLPIYSGYSQKYRQKLDYFLSCAPVKCKMYIMRRNAPGLRGWQK